MGMSELVSAIMLTNNRLEFAKKSIKMFAEQDYNNKELVIINNGGTQYFNELQKFINNGYSDVSINHVFLHKKPTGELRNSGLKHAKGVYIATWDDDDECAKDRLSMQINEIKNNNADACLLQCFTISIANKKFNIKNPNGLEPTFVFKKNSLEYMPLWINEDFHFIKGYKDNYKVIVHDNGNYDAYIYTYHGKNLSSSEHFMLHITSNKV